MKAIISSIVMILSAQAFSASTFCQENFPDNAYDFNVLRESTNNEFLLNNWEMMPNIQDFERQYCEDVVGMELVKVKSRFFWVFRSTEDSCDGGNTYGVVYNYSLTKPVADISDGDVGCL